MEIHPKDIAGSSIAIFLWDIDGECGGSAIMYGTSRFSEGNFYVERDQEPLRMPIPESAWGNIRENLKREKGKRFETVDYIVMLRLGPMPEGDSTEDYQEINIPILDQ